MEIKYSDDVKLVINITEQMAADYRECALAAEKIKGPGKDCKTCSLAKEIVEDYSLCELPAVRAELEKRKRENEMLGTVKEMMEHICDDLCRHPAREGISLKEVEKICADCRMDKFMADIMNAYNKLNDFENTQCAALMKKYAGFVRCNACEYHAYEKSTGKHWCRMADGLYGELKTADGCTRGKEVQG